VAAPVGGPAAVERMIVLGDSLSDTGNVDDLTFGLIPGSPYWQGRFSDGPVWVERLAGRLDVPVPAPSRLGGTNYAHGGARTGPGFSSFIIPNIGPQLNGYVADGPPPASGDLLVLFAGGNDFIDGRLDPAVPVANLTAHLTELAAHGVQRVLVASLPPLGRTPRALGTADEPLLDGLVASFNAQYAEALAALGPALGLTIHRLDVHDLFERIMAAPESFGLTNVTEPAYDESTGSVVPDPQHYLFWDDLHPTSAAHVLLGDRAAARIACPADADGSGAVDVDDLVETVLAWGTVGFDPADADDDGVVGVDDLLEVILAWGPCP
jgi:3-phytase